MGVDHLALRITSQVGLLPYFQTRKQFQTGGPPPTSQPQSCFPGPHCSAFAPRSMGTMIYVLSAARGLKFMRNAESCPREVNLKLIL